MKRRTLDTIFASGGIIVALLLAVLGFVLVDQASFANNYVKDELSAQKITFAPVANLSDAEKNWKPGSSCLTTYAGQLMTSGPMAECYAKYYIREHMHAAADAAGFPGATYATIGTASRDLGTQLTAAKNANNTSLAADLQKKIDAATSLRSTLQLGESLSGMLLTTYGFSVIASKAEFAANILYALAGVMVLLSVAGFVHAFVTPKDKVVFAGVGSRVPSGA